MRSFIDFNRKKDSDTLFPVQIRNREFLPRTLLRMENSRNWSSAASVGELEEQFHSAENKNESIASLKGESAPAKKLFKRANELFFPLVLVLFLGTIAFAIGRHMEASVPSVSPNDISNAPASDVILSGHITDSTHVYPDSNSLHEKSISSVRADSGTTQANKSEELDKGYYREHWGKFMILTNSTYKHRFLGGIKGLAITFTNNTDFQVNKVVAAITYLKPNHKPWKTKLIPLYNIAPHSEKEQRIDNVCRGKLVQISIKKINCSDLNLHFTSGDKIK